MPFRHTTRFIIGNPTSCPQQQEGHVPTATAYETVVNSILGFSLKAY